MSTSTAAGWWRNRTWWWVALAVVVVAVVVAVVLLNRPSTGSAASTPSGSGPSATLNSSLGASPSAAPSAETVPAPSTPSSAEPEQQAVPEPLPTAVSPMDSEVEAAPAVGVRVASVEAVQGEAVQAGDVGGPALRVTVEVANGAQSAQDLSGAVVNLYYGPDLTPASPLLRPGGRTLPGSVAAGEAVTGVYLFSVPASVRDHVRVEVDAQIGGVVVAFEGPAPS